MFLFLDITQISKEIKRIKGKCIKCREPRELVFLKTYQCFRIFLIPVWKWGVKYYIADEICGAMYLISEEDALLIENNKKEISDCALEDTYEGTTRCMDCKRELSKDYMFCPYCGKKRE